MVAGYFEVDMAIIAAVDLYGENMVFQFPCRFVCFFSAARTVRHIASTFSSGCLLRI